MGQKWKNEGGLLVRKLSQEDLEKEDLANRIAAIEAHLKAKDPNFKVPDPPAGLQRLRRGTE
ncbi:MAG: hypothetical protein H0Z35_12345 [Thermoanaerobacteraceae bacterium]|nr:hypothetical protein [Thermoanaerobacteraceae bacterium]